MKDYFNLPIRLITVSCIFIVCLLLLYLAIQNGPAFLGKPKTAVDLSRGSVIKEMQSLGRLETSSFTIEKIIEAGTQGNAFQELIYGDRILLIAHGKVVAGVDLTSLTDKDVLVEGTTLKLMLPATSIFVSTLDSSQTKVYDRRLGLLSQGDKDLESQTRSAAESSIRQAACAAGIMQESAKNARERLTKMFELVGFEQVQVEVQPGSC